MENKVFTPLEYDNSTNTDVIRVFLAGTIDSDKSYKWQPELVKQLIEIKEPLYIYNPRREKWPEDSDHDEVNKQIEWELYHLEKADLIIMNILPDSKSPICLMEIGLFARQHKLVVFCQPSFYRYDNVKIVCNKYKVPLYNSNYESDIKEVIEKFAIWKDIDLV